MNPFTRIQRDVRENQIYRDALLAQPQEFFLQHFGVVPNILERLRFVEKLIQSTGAPHAFMNDLYTVRMRDASPFIQLDITRRDGEACKNWRDFQQIKNELVGAECEAVELFPAESRLVDTANQYHLWVNPDANFRFPFGYKKRVVLNEPVIYRGRAGNEVAGSAGVRIAGDSMAKNRAEDSAS
ncbi:hypothetical protein CfE428DRAFT_2527 [Chthoniobacter flavus Ellin428]|uniref:DUF7694 domain-containing protein n=1 Tax=Chthoniobacter flavus Ellin428 TaxID=497964 RepID=B4D0S6_9BACT|nr:hypothetical protein [Chthoniobacter flavus]EDY19938.1 hypothetical protein CfE428DRAFT_2527 [Chthoniobacter flavus Ellin428]TCO91791.1 hypothetical protein EV701_10772 [Chthoniobacter flavus]